MQQPLLKNLLSEPGGFFIRAFQSTEFLHFISRFTGSRFCPHQLNFFYTVGGQLASPGGDSSFLEMVFKGVQKCNSRTGLNSENMGFHSCSLLQISCIAFGSSLCPIESNSASNHHGKWPVSWDFSLHLQHGCHHGVPKKGGYTYSSKGHAQKMWWKEQCKHTWEVPERGFGGEVLQAVWSNGHRSAGLGLRRPAALGLSPCLVGKNRGDAPQGQICDSADPHCRQRQWPVLATFCHLLPPRPQQPQLLLWRGDSAQPSLVPLEFTYSFVHQFVWPLADPICLLWQPLPDIHCFWCKTTFFHLFWVPVSFVDCLLALSEQ